MKHILIIIIGLLIAVSCEKEENIIQVSTTVCKDASGTIVDCDDENSVTPMAEIGVFTGAYNLQGTFIVDGSGITINNDYQGTTAPGPVWYLSNNQKGVSGGVRLENARKGAGGYKIETNVALDYKYLVMWCQPFSVYIGHGIIKK